MLSDLFSDVSLATLFVVLLLQAGCLIIIIAVCLPSVCREKPPKDDVYGVEGRMTLTNPDVSYNNVEHCDEMDARELSNGQLLSEEHATDDHERASTLNRQLPDIPADNVRIDVEEARNGDVQTRDNNSELYATVGDRQSDVSEVSKSKPSSTKKRPAPKAPAVASSSRQSSSSLQQSEPNLYSQVKKENPYAKVQGQESVEGEADETDTDTSLYSDVRGRMVNQPSNHNPPIMDIPAASAIGGRIPANPELPYMTPPIVTEQPNQQHFSGDSQDSKGYTSISVREPLATLKARTQQENTDSHYATVSDDSEEMYAAIEDSAAAYVMEESDTYMNVDNYTSVDGKLPPAPPSVDSLKHVAQVHSRQDGILFSSASSSSSIAASPKSEKRMASNDKRMANSYHGSSVLAPSNSDPYFDSRRATLESGLSGPPKSLDEMYAKVTKKNKAFSLPRGNDICKEGPSTSGFVPERISEKMIIHRRSKTEINFSEFEVVRDVAPIIETNNNSLSDPGYETVKGNGHVNRTISDASSTSGYAKIKEKIREDDLYDSEEPAYESVQHQHHHGYESVHHTKRKHGGYEKIKSRTKKTSDPGYESVREDPMYETLRSNESENDPNYEKVKDKEEPPYSSLKDFVDVDLAPPLYAQVTKKRKAPKAPRRGSSPCDPDIPKLDLRRQSLPIAEQSDLEPPYESTERRHSKIVGLEFL